MKAIDITYWEEDDLIAIGEIGFQLLGASVPRKVLARFAMEAHWQPLTYASGDYCDVVAMGAERYLVAIGDVVGHGARTALIQAAIHTLQVESDWRRFENWRIYSWAQPRPPRKPPPYDAVRIRTKVREPSYG